MLAFQYRTIIALSGQRPGGRKIAVNRQGLLMITTSPPEQGQLVRVRSRPWVLNVVKPSNLPTAVMKLPVGGTQNLLMLSSVEDDE